MEDQKITEFKLKRHKLLGVELEPLGLYIIDVLSDGSCQFAALITGLETLVEDPSSSIQGLRDQLVNYLLGNRVSLEEGQQIGFLHGDPDFKKDVLSAYGKAYNFDLYCNLMRNPIGVRANCEWGD